MIACPSSRNEWILASSALVSDSDSAVVGSSKISTRGFAPSTFAISTSWRTASEVSSTGVFGSSQSRPTRSSIVLALRLISLGRRMPRRAGTRRAPARGAPPPPGGGGGLDRAGVAHVTALDLVRALIALDRAGEDLDQRALAGAVLAGEAVHLAGAQLQRDVLERPDRAGALP